MAENEFEGILQDEGARILRGIKEVELDPTGLDTLFNCDQPLKLSREQRAVVVEGLRRSREKYLANKAKKAANKKKRERITPEGVEDLSLDDLKLDLTDLV